MASGRVGGTRSKISGVVGNDVYTIRKESNGSYQQVVAPLPESRPDTLTPAKVIERILMSIVYKYMQAIPAILTEAFGDTLTKSLNLQDFVRQNIRRLRERMEEQEWPRGPIYFYDYGDPYFYPAPLIVSQGKAPLPLSSGEMVFEQEGVWTFTATLARYHQGITVRQWMKDNKMSVGDILVPMVMVVDDIPYFNRLLFERYVFAPAVDLDTVITPELFPTLWDTPENPKIKLKCRLFGAEDLLNPYFELTQADAGGQRACAGYALIKSGIVNGVWERSTSYVSTFKQTGSKASLVNTLEDVWDSWYTDRISPEPEPEPEPTPEPYSYIDYIVNNGNVGFDIDFKLIAKFYDFEADLLRVGRVNYTFIFSDQNGKGNVGLLNTSSDRRLRINIYTSSTNANIVYMIQADDMNRHKYSVRHEDGVIKYYLDETYVQQKNIVNNLPDTFDGNLYMMGGPNSKFEGECFGFKVWDSRDGSLLVDMRPAIRLSDSAYGFHDVARNLFFTNPDLSGN